MKQPNPTQGYKIDKSSLISLEKGKIPPQALDLEEVVLGAMMIDKKGVDEVIDILSPDAFYKEAHRYIFESIFKLFENSEPVTDIFGTIDRVSGVISVRSSYFSQKTTKYFSGKCKKTKERAF